jgi:predicted peptidase
LRSLCLVCCLTFFADAFSFNAFGEDDLFEEHTYVYTGGPYKKETFRYRLLKPAKIERGKTYPLVVFLHGAGERGVDNRKQLLYLPAMMASAPWRKRFPCFLLAPQCRAGKQWVNVPWGDSKSTPMSKQPSHQLQMARKILAQTIGDNPVDRDRVYLTGLSMGGYGAWELATRNPTLFAAVAPICGGGDERLAKQLSSIPIWAFHGDKDGAVPVVRSRTMIQALKKSGGQPKYTEYPGAGHNVWTKAYSDPKGVIPWLFKQTRPTSDKSR